MGRKRSRSDLETTSSSKALESPFRECVVECTASLPPSYIGRAHQGINELLNSRLVEFDERVGGVLLSYWDVIVKEGVGHVFADVPEIQFRVKYNALFFSPRKGMVLEGYIRQVTAGHIMLHAFGVFNVAVTSDRISQVYKYDSSSEAFVDKKNPDGLALRVGEKARFTVLALQGASGGSFYVEASIPDPENVAHLSLSDKQPEKEHKKKEKKEKKKKSKKTK